MKKLLISAVLALTLVAIMAVPAVAETSNIDASVTVNTYASVTITDNGDAGLDFGSLNPGDYHVPEASSPSVTITAASENNVDITILISGTDFSDGGTNSFSIGVADYNRYDDIDTALPMSNSPQPLSADIPPGGSMDIYHWISIDGTMAPGSYSSTFTYTSSS